MTYNWRGKEKITFRPTGRMEMQNECLDCLRGGWALRGILKLKRSSWRREGSQPLAGAHQSRVPMPGTGVRINLAVKLSDHLGEIEGMWKLRCFLKVPAHRLTHLQAHTLGTGKGSTAGEAQETYRKRLMCVAMGLGLEGQLPLALCQILLQGQSVGGCHLILCWACPNTQILNLHWLVGLACSIPWLLVTPSYPAHELPTADSLPCNCPHPENSVGDALDSSQQSSACGLWVTHTSQETHLVEGS